MSKRGRGERVVPFELGASRYDAWFGEHVHAFRSELAALGEVLGRPERAVEVGVGTGRFADALGIGLGIDPAGAACRVARGRGVEAVRGVGEAIPLVGDAFDLVLMVTTVGFLEDVEGALDEVKRVLEPGGALVVGFIDRETRLGEAYERERSKNPFYAPATFRSARGLMGLLEARGFDVEAARQTLFLDPGELDGVDRVEDGVGEGGFVALRARVTR